MHQMDFKRLQCSIIVFRQNVSHQDAEAGQRRPASPTSAAPENAIRCVLEIRIESDVSELKFPAAVSK